MSHRLDRKLQPVILNINEENFSNIILYFTKERFYVFIRSPEILFSCDKLHVFPLGVVVRRGLSNDYMGIEIRTLKLIWSSFPRDSQIELECLGELQGLNPPCTVLK